jgi:hypothetical protein
MVGYSHGMADVVLQQELIASVNHVHVLRARFRHTCGSLPRTSILLGLTVMLVLAMPMNYRAGTETTHPHAVFQTVIDTVTGRHHHPGDGHLHTHAATSSAALSPFAPPSVPLNALHGQDQPSLPSASMHIAPDVPSIASMKPSLDQPVTIVAAGMLVLLAAVVVRRSCWHLVRIPGDTAIAPEPPPPRLLAALASF